MSALAASGLFQLGCGLFSSSFVAPPELAYGAHRYSLLVDYQSFSTDKPKRRVDFRPVPDPENAAPPGTCRFAFQLAGEFDERPSEPAREDRGFLVWRYPSRFAYRIEAPPGPRLDLQGTGERVVIEQAGDGPTKEKAPLGEVSVDQERVKAREGHGQLSSDGKTLGEIKRENAKLSVYWGDTLYLSDALSEAERSVRKDKEMVLYAKLDWGHWGVGERAFQVAADPSLDCEQLQRVVSVLLMAQLFTGE